MFKKVKISLKENACNWMDKFRKIVGDNKKHAQYWFWENFNIEQQSIWIGKFNKMNNLPQSDDQIIFILKKIMDDLEPSIKSRMYIKLYFSRNVSNHEPEINYLLICNTPNLPSEFSNTLMNVVFEKYQLTKNIIDKNENFKKLINHYINWNNFYNYYDLMGELQY